MIKVKIQKHLLGKDLRMYPDGILLSVAEMGEKSVTINSYGTLRNLDLQVEEFLLDENGYDFKDSKVISKPFSQMPQTVEEVKDIYKNILNIENLECELVTEALL